MNECSAQQMTWEEAEASKKILLSFAGSGMRVCVRILVNLVLLPS